MIIADITGSISFRIHYLEGSPVSDDLERHLLTLIKKGVYSVCFKTNKLKDKRGLATYKIIWVENEPIVVDCDGWSSN